MEYAATLPVVGMDIAKNVFQLHVVDNETGEIQRHKLKREKVTEFFANHQRSLIAVEACGGAHNWARTLQSLGHEVKLLPAKHVKPFVLRDKTDARDAQAIWVAAQQRYIKPVPVKSEQQQACLALHRLRAQLMKMRIMQTNGLRGLLYEFGIVLPVGHRVLLQRIQGELAKAQEQGTLPSVLVASVQDQLRRIDGLQEDIDQLDRRLVAMSRQDQHMQALQVIPGIGPLTATALVSTATGADPASNRYGWQDPSVGNLQARRPLRTDHVDARSQSSHHSKYANVLDSETVATTTIQRGGRRSGQQVGANGVGDPGQRQSL
jgi:transposase